MAALRAAGCVFAEDEAELLMAATDDPARLEAMVSRRASGVPIEYVVGWAGFGGLRVEVDPGVFVPRYRTEVLAELAVGRTRPGAVVVDLCCGSGAIGLVVASRVAGVRLVASDVDPVAVACARRNLAHVAATVVCGDLFDALPRDLVGAVDILLTNVPYVPSGAVAYLPAEAREHEPLSALDGGGDGLDVLRRVAAQAGSWLTVGGLLFVETSHDQADVAASVLRQSGLRSEVVVDDERDVAVVIGARPS